MAKHFRFYFEAFGATFEHHAPQISMYARMHNCFEITKHSRTYIHTPTLTLKHTHRV